jgi:hypothetical protein
MRQKPTDRQERTDRQTEILRELPGFHLDTGTPCECGADRIKTRTRRGYSDSLIFDHRCTACGSAFSTFIEG